MRSGAGRETRAPAHNFSSQARFSGRVFLSSVADHDGLPEKMELSRRSLGSGRAATGATDTFSRRPLSAASRPFVGRLLKGSEGSRAVVLAIETAIGLE